MKNVCYGNYSLVPTKISRLFDPNLHEMIVQNIGIQAHNLIVKILLVVAKGKGVN